jgi:hypothetical protein
LAISILHTQSSQIAAASVSSSTTPSTYPDNTRRQLLSARDTHRYRTGAMRTSENSGIGEVRRIHLRNGLKSTVSGALAVIGGAQSGSKGYVKLPSFWGSTGRRLREDPQDFLPAQVCVDVRRGLLSTPRSSPPSLCLSHHPRKGRPPTQV